MNIPTCSLGAFPFFEIGIRYYKHIIKRRFNLKQKVTVTLDREVVSGIETLQKHGWTRSSFINYVLNLHIRAMIEMVMYDAKEVAINDIRTGVK